MTEKFQGYLRSDGRKGIRNTVVVAYLVECAHFVASKIVAGFDDDEDVQLIGFPGCFPNEYAARVMGQLCTHPNVGAVLFVSLGCESFDKVRAKEPLQAPGARLKPLSSSDPAVQPKQLKPGAPGCVPHLMKSPRSNVPRWGSMN